MSEQEKARQLRKRMWATIVAASLALVMVILCAVSGAFNFHKGTNMMPNVIGMTEEGAVEAIEKLDATPLVTYQYDDETAGIVISQGVEAGVNVKHNTTVTIVVSQGPQEGSAASSTSDAITLPNLVGLTMELAEKTAEQLGVLIVEDGYVNDDYIPYGSVAEQSPEGGAVVQPRSLVTVKLSAGPAVQRYTISVECGENGSVSPEGDITREEGTDVMLRFTPDNGYEVESLVIDGEEVNPLSEYHFLDLDDNHTVRVTFRERSGIGSLLEQIFGIGNP